MVLVVFIIFLFKIFLFGSLGIFIKGNLLFFLLLVVKDLIVVVVILVFFMVFVLFLKKIVILSFVIVGSLFIILDVFFIRLEDVIVEDGSFGLIIKLDVIVFVFFIIVFLLLNIIV